MILRVGDFTRHGPKCRLIGPRDEEVVPGVDDRTADRRNLIGGLSGAEHDLRSTLPQRPVVIDASKAKILEGASSQNGFELIVGVVDTHRAVAYVFEDRAKLIVIHVASVGSACRRDGMV